METPHPCSRVTREAFDAMTPMLQAALNVLPEGCREIIRVLKARFAKGDGYTLDYSVYSSHWQLTSSDSGLTIETFETYKSRVNGAFRKLDREKLTVAMCPCGIDPAEMTVGLSEVPRVGGTIPFFALVWTPKASPRVCKLVSNPYESVKRIASPRHPSLAQVFRSDELLADGWSIEQILQSIDQLDDASFRELDDQQRCSAVVIRKRIEEYPNTSRFVVDEQRAVTGYWSIFPMELPHYQGFRAGRSLDSELNFGMIPLLEMGGRFNAYFISICRSPVLGDPFRCRRQLLLSIMHALCVFAEDGVFFDEICAHAWSDEGERLCKGFEMTPVGPHRSGKGFVFARRVYPFPEMGLIRPFPRLEELYKETTGSSTVVTRPIDLTDVSTSK